MLDGAGFNEVMADLALLYRLDGAPAPLPPPTFDRGALPPIPDVTKDEFLARCAKAKWEIDPWLKGVQWVIARIAVNMPWLMPLPRRFGPVRFSEAALGRLKQASSANGGCSTGDALLAHCMRLLSANKDATPLSPPPKSTSVRLWMNARAKLPALPSRLVANVTVPLMIRPPGRGGLLDAAEIRKQLEVNAASAEELYELWGLLVPHNGGSAMTMDFHDMMSPHGCARARGTVGLPTCRG